MKFIALLFVWFFMALALFGAAYNGLEKQERMYKERNV